jgi:hypothetical protein
MFSKSRYGVWKLRRRSALVGAMAAVLLTMDLAAVPAAAPAAADPNDGQFAVILQGFFPGQTKSGETKQLNCYLVRREGKWTAALATATNAGRPNWNTATMPLDPSQLTLEGKRLSGTLRITLVPDPWVPKDQKPREAVVKIDAALGEPQEKDAIAGISGKWTATIDGKKDELAAALLSPQGEGKIAGKFWPTQERDTADSSYDLALYNLVPGTTNANFHRRRAISLGVKGGRIVSARLGQMDMRHNAYDYETLDAPQDCEIDEDQFRASVSFTADTLDGERAAFVLQLKGQRVGTFITGTWKGHYTDEAGKKHETEGFLRGSVRPGAFVGTAVKDDRPWFVPVKGFKPVQPGEHPRLFFRKADVPELRRRAATPEGQRIVKRLRQLLNGSDGETLPTLYNPAKQAYEKNKFKAAPGAYSIASAAGFGFLYQLTGDKKYAALARQCVEKGWQGQRDFDDRYAWVAPGGELRAGPSIAWTAVAYDLCYDAWEPAFRTKAALAIQNYADTRGGEWNNPEGITLRKMVLQPRQGPGSNHYGAVCGGCGLAVLAIKDDPGTDAKLLNKYLEVLEQHAVRQLSAGWGDGGYYQEGWGASQVGTQGGFLCFLQALKVAAGHDYLNVDRPNASYVTMVPRAMMLLGPPAVYPYRSNMGGTYGSPEFHRERAGFSHGGHFCEGFGAVADKHKPGLLWVYNHCVVSDPADHDFDTPSLYAFRPMLALVNWPTFAGVQERNPAEAMPRVTRDQRYDYFVFRNRWQDADDIVATVLIRQPDGTRPRNVMVWGLRTRNELPEPQRNVPVTHFQAGKDGSGTLSTAEWAMAVDYSGASGADALVVTVGTSKGGKPGKEDAKARQITLESDGKTFTVLTLSRDGRHPEARLQGNRLTVGKQTIDYADGKLAIGGFRPQLR